MTTQRGRDRLHRGRWMTQTVTDRPMIDRVGRLDSVRPVPTLRAMAALLFRRLLACLTVVAYLGAASAVPVVCADAADLAGSAIHETSGQPDTPMPPCKGMADGCMTGPGCAFLTGTLVPPVKAGAAFAWSSITYHATAAALHGRTLEPVLGPPISRA